MNDRDKTIFNRIIRYADEVAETITRFELDEEKFLADFVVKNSITMSLLQIGELANHLTKEIQSEHSEIGWHEIIAFRNRAVHGYGQMDAHLIWNAAVSKVPELKAFCETKTR